MVYKDCKHFSSLDFILAPNIDNGRKAATSEWTPPSNSIPSHVGANALQCSHRAFSLTSCYFALDGRHTRIATSRSTKSLTLDEYTASESVKEVLGLHAKRQ